MTPFHHEPVFSTGWLLLLNSALPHILLTHHQGSLLQAFLGIANSKLQASMNQRSEELSFLAAIAWLIMMVCKQKMTFCLQICSAIQLLQSKHKADGDREDFFKQILVNIEGMHHEHCSGTVDPTSHNLWWIVSWSAEIASVTCLYDHFPLLTTVNTHTTDLNVTGQTFTKLPMMSMKVFDHW